jgi:uncharacterized RDD family membrane protein YckC
MEPTDSNAEQGSPPTGPVVTWSPPADPPELPVPGAPGLSFADTKSRAAAFVVDTAVLGTVAIVLGLLFGGPFGEPSSPLRAAVLTVANLLIGAAYFVLSWTSARRATPGQRLLQLQVGNAFRGETVTLRQAVIRWLALGQFLLLLELLPIITASFVDAAAQLAWSVVLLVSTARSPTRQGLHDRLANTAVVRPSGLRTSPVAVACLVLVGLVILAIALSFVSLIVMGPSAFEELSRIGQSIRANPSFAAP